jgi:hypothetical protein
MTVAELIKVLQSLPQDATVYVVDLEHGEEELERLETEDGKVILRS